MRVRFAPSPTGNLHIGGARTALFCYLAAKKFNGSFVLRVEDTDLARSSSESEKSILEDLKWLGLNWDEGPYKGGSYAPYRQSERKDIYLTYINKLIENKQAFKCFCSEELLESKKKKAQEDQTSQHYDGTCLNLSEKEIEENLSKNIPFTVRFKAFEKNFSFKDLVRGEVTFPKGMIGDFVIQRSNGMPVYNFCCAIDDYLMKIDVVIRGEEHLPNTLRQLMIYEVLGSCPQFAHVSLLIGEDRQKLSKRHGHTSLKEFKEKGILPQTMINYLSLLGWSHPEEKDIYNLEELVSVFSLDRFSKASAIFDIKKFFYINSEHIKLMSWSEINKQIETYFATCDYTLEASWKEKFIELFKNYSDKLDSFKEHFKELFLSKVELDVDAKAVMAYDTQSALLKVVENYTWRDTVWISLEEIEELMKELKSQKIKGKNLFMGLRVAFTGKTHGPDLKVILQLTPLPILKERLKQVKTYV